MFLMKRFGKYEFRCLPGVSFYAVGRRQGHSGLGRRREKNMWRGVSSIEELLEAPVADLSPEAAACGVTPGMKGRKALMLMEKK